MSGARFSFLIVFALSLSPAVAVAHAESGVGAATQGRIDTGTVSFPAAFFDDYRPVNAREMVERIPGFQLSNGSNARGFAGTAGNVLINGERPSSKTDRVSDILERIPAREVLRIDLIRGNTGRFDAGGQAVLANVIVATESRSWTWNAQVEQDTDSGGPTPGASLSVIDRRGNTEWGGGVELSTSYVGNSADEQRLGADGIEELRDEFERSRQHSIRFNANSATRWNRRMLRLNAEVGYRDSDFRENSRRTPLLPPGSAFNLDRRSDSDRFDFEVGGDFEWPVGPESGARVVGLFRRIEDSDFDQQLLGPDRSSVAVQQSADRESIRSEGIARAEFDHSGFRDRQLELDLELALNSLDNSLALREIDSTGRLVPVEVPGANNRVEELRSDLQLRDTWKRGTISVETELGAEASEIRQSGAGAPDQRFFFVKPSLTIVHAPNERRIHRFGLSRRIAQLDFDDFISAANFSDGDIDRGNPNLKPQQTWLVEWSSEARFGDIGAAQFRAFHRWISDVQDRLPIDDRFEVPGNIGDGRRWGVELEGTLPLNALLRSGRSRLDFSGRWEDSSVTDPVTGRDRSLSGSRKFEVEGEFRQDLIGEGWAWGVETEYEDARIVYELDEIDVDERGVDLGAFIETTRFFGVKMQLIAQNLLDRRFERNRQVFDGARGAGQLSFQEIRDRRRGRSVLLSISGSF